MMRLLFENGDPAADLVFDGKKAESLLGFRGVDFPEGFGALGANGAVGVIQGVDELGRGRKRQSAQLVQCFCGGAAHSRPGVGKRLRQGTDPI